MVMTQQLIANMLGMPRDGATAGAFRMLESRIHGAAPKAHELNRVMASKVTEAGL
jgi:hypothetical protein